MVRLHLGSRNNIEKNNGLIGKTIGAIAKEQNKGIIDAFLDIVVEEGLDTVFVQGQGNVDKEAATQILNYPNAIIGLSDGGAHVQLQGDYDYSTYLLSHWVREEKIMTLEQAVRRLTFDSASIFGIYDRGLLIPGKRADITIFNQQTIKPLAEDIVHDFPHNGWRVRQLADGIKATVVNGQVLIQEGKPTGLLPGRIIKNARFLLDS